MQFVQRVTSNPDAYKLLTDWGLTIDEGTINLVARILPPETLFFGQGRKEIIGPRGDWNRSATSSVLTAVDLRKWAILFWERNKTQAQGFCQMMQRVSQKMGIKIANPKVRSKYKLETFIITCMQSRNYFHYLNFEISILDDE